MTTTTRAAFAACLFAGIVAGTLAPRSATAHNRNHDATLVARMATSKFYSSQTERFYPVVCFSFMITVDPDHLVPGHQHSLSMRHREGPYSTTPIIGQGEIAKN